MALGGSGSIDSPYLNVLQSQANQNNPLGFNAEAERANPVRAEGIDKNSFLQLLITQLQHQDPTNPMDNMQFSGQLAQFASVEQLQNLNSNFGETQKSQQVAQFQGLVGKEVSYSAQEGGKEVRKAGVVDAVRIMDDGTFALIGGNEINISEIDTIIRAGFQMTEQAEPQGAAREAEEDQNSAAAGDSEKQGLLSRLFR